MKQTKKKIAVIGTGIMGSGIAVNFLNKGYPVVAWNRSKAKLNRLKKLGAILAKTPKEATERADIVFEVTANDKSSRGVWLGKQGILTGADDKKTLITNATLSVKWVDELATRCHRASLKFVDIPMTGGRIGAETGKLVLLVGGKENLYNLERDLTAISEKRYYFGKVGSGMRFKLILNALQAIHIGALGEAIRLAQAMNLDVEKAGQVLTERPGGTTTNMAWRDYLKEPDPINFSVDWIAKDLKYAKKSARKIDTPLLDEMLGKYKRMLKAGKGKNDWTAVNKV